MSGFDALSDYQILRRTHDIRSFLIAGGQILCADADEWDLALDLAEEAGFDIGFPRIEYRPDGVCATKGSRCIYYAKYIKEVHSYKSDGGVPLCEIISLFLCKQKTRLCVDESCELFA